MFRILNLHTLFGMISEELSARLSKGKYSAWTGALRIHTDIGSVILHVDNGHVTVVDEACSVPIKITVDLQQDLLIQLMLGYKDVGSVALEKGVSIPTESHSLLDEMFPGGYPLMAWHDQF